MLAIAASDNCVDVVEFILSQFQSASSTLVKHIKQRDEVHKWKACIRVMHLTPASFFFNVLCHADRCHFHVVGSGQRLL